MTNQFPRNGIEMYEYANAGRGTVEVYKNKVRYTDNASGQHKDIVCKNQDDAKFQNNFFKRSFELKQQRNG